MRWPSTTSTARALLLALILLASFSTGLIGSDEDPTRHEMSIADAQLSGIDESGKAGRSVALAGDVNGDGVDDVLVGAKTAENRRGAAYLVHGPITANLSLADADATFVGETFQDWAGYDVAGAGDVDGDGYADVLVGAPQNDNEGGSKAGAGYLFYGPVTGTHDLSDADARITGEESSNLAGWSLASAGDVDGDGLDEIVIGAYWNDEGGHHAGAAYLVDGPVHGHVPLQEATAKLVGERSPDWAGHDVAGAGDVNGDGFDDLVIGAPYVFDGNPFAGAAYVVYGPIANDLDLSQADAKLIGGHGKEVGDPVGDFAGFSVDIAGDVNADGYDDVVIGAQDEDTNGNDAGSAYLLYGPVHGTSDLADADAVFHGNQGGDEAGRSVAGIGDVNADGYDDLAIGAPREDDQPEARGSVHVVYGPAHGAMNLSESDLTLVGEAEGDKAGYAVAAAGDANAGGVADLIAGVHEHEDETGSAYVVLGEQLDRDDDGVPDLTERDTYASDPLDPDTDGDLADDGTETACGSSPTDPTSTPATAPAPTIDIAPDELPTSDDRQPLPGVATQATCTDVEG